MISKILIVSALLTALCALGKAPEPIFHLSMNQEPISIDPQKQGSAVISYFLQSVYRGLLWFDNEKGLQPDLAESCEWKKKSLVLHCTLKKDLKWSDGTPLTSNHFLQAYQYLLTDSGSAYRASLLFPIKNAERIFEKKSPIEQLGIRTLDQRTIEFTLEKPFSEFEYHLTQTALSPRPPNEKAFSGPYTIKEWLKGKKIILTRNLHYPLKNSRPDVEFLFVLDDNSGLKLYEKGQLDFLRRLPTAMYPTWKDKPDFKAFEVLRFDYFGFNTKLTSPEQRKTLSSALDYPELQRVFNSVGLPGCAALPAKFFENEKIPCVDFDLKLAQSLKSKIQKWPELKISYSTQGGDDHRRMAEWMQSQWKKNLVLEARIQGMENKLFLSQLKSEPTVLFRKGITLERPTCSAALENFTQGSSENYVGLQSKELDELVQQLYRSTQSKEQQKLCTAGVQILLKENHLIPSGRFDFYTLIKSHVQGLKLNLMNQLDLSQLELK